MTDSVWSTVPERTSGLILGATTLAVSTVIVILTTSLVRSALISSPYINALGPLIAVSLVALATISCLTIIGLLLLATDSIAPANLYGYRASSIIGTSGLFALGLAGIIIVGCALAWISIPRLVVAPDEETTTAGIMAAAPLVVAFVHFLRPSTGRMNKQTGYKGQIEPVLVKDTVPTPDNSQTLEERNAEVERQNNVQEPEYDAPRDNNPSTSLDERLPNDAESTVQSARYEFDWATKTDVSFSDVGGMGELKTELREDVIIPLKEYPEKAEELGVSTSNIVLHGPPGTGKTYIAKALATELELPFTKLSGSNIQSKWINESASKVSSLFNEAEKIAKRSGGAIIFLDELDTVLKERTGNSDSHEEDMKVVNEFLNHLEETGDNDVVFIGATNRVDALDEAGIRSGRIDKKVHIGKPDGKARAKIIQAQLNERPNNVNDRVVKWVADQTEGAVASDLELIVKEAAKDALISDEEKITKKNIKFAVESLDFNSND